MSDWSVIEWPPAKVEWWQPSELSAAPEAPARRVEERPVADASDLVAQAVADGRLARDEAPRWLAWLQREPLAGATALAGLTSLSAFRGGADEGTWDAVLAEWFGDELASVALSEGAKPGAEPTGLREDVSEEQLRAFFGGDLDEL